ncbi:hypothetical protein C2S51_032767 [Perilla frutescens var. frutescens]|nr:hypothetical protein C2S51_032767 [Perilla frutescens var. frutescens]
MAGAARQTRGRQKIPMRLIENQDDLYASFSKRRIGVFKKASELSTLCGADVAVVVFSPTDNPFSFFSPNMESVIDRYLSPEQPLKRSARAIDAHSRARIEELNKRLDELVEEKHNLKQVEERFDKSRQRGWWEETAVDALHRDQLRDWIAFFKNFKSEVENQLHHLQNISTHQFGNEEANMNISESSINGGSSSQYFYRPLPSRTYVGSSNSHVISPYNYVSPGAQDPIFNGGGGGGGGAYLDQSVVDGSGQHFGNPPAPTFCFPPHYRHVPSGSQNLSAAAAETNELATATATTQGQRGD